MRNKVIFRNFNGHSDFQICQFFAFCGVQFFVSFWKKEVGSQKGFGILLGTSRRI
jgi:hypothetical protein